MTDRYEEWRDFYAKRVSSWMSLEELRAECGKLTTTDATSPELLLIHAMRALEECVQRDEAMRAEIEALRADRDSWEKQAADRVADWHAEYLRAERLRAEVERFRTDAERYRWLRDKGDSITVCECADDGEWIPLHPENIDATIDAAMEADRG